MPNQLIHSTSPYLLQHAHNPVDWYEWGTEALAKAKLENKPILVSIGYSACHWCHVMAHESFENKEIAAVMNEKFVCIKVDREERPDVDQVYMEAVQLLGINGGWPLNVFLTPDQKPFYGGTYFPPSNWKNILQQVSQVFKDRRPEIDASAEEIAGHLNKSDVQRFTRDGNVGFRKEQLNKMFSILESRFDKMHGGLAKAPKFVMPAIWMLLLRYFAVTGKTQAKDMVGLTLRKMTSAGLYDQVGGGFARYSVDGEWFAPHFEKMLYDNGQLLTLYAEMYSLTKDNFCKNICTETIGWLAREMKHPGGGFYSALDADSEGEEGKFYVWTWDELQDTVKEKEAMEYFGAEPSGNWEHGRNILMRGEADGQKVKAWQQLLLTKRSERIRPGTDDKILTGWNGIAIKGLVDTFLATGTKEYLDLAIGGMTFIETYLADGMHLYRSFKEKRSQTGGFLEDYAFVIQSCLALYQATFQEKWVYKAEALTEHVIQEYYDKESGYFHFTADSAEALIARKKEIFDNVIPSSNSVMARSLYHLGIVFDRREWTTMAEEMVSKLAPTIEGEPAYLSNWGILLTEMIKGMAEVVIVGAGALNFNHELQRNFLPFALFMGTTGTSRLPLLSDKVAVGGETTIYVCFQKSCKMPVKSVEEALTQMTSPRPSPGGEGEKN